MKLSEIVPTKDHVILAFGMYVWGKSKANAHDAIRIARREGGSDKWILYNAPADVWVDDMGSARWDGDPEALVKIGTVKKGKFTPEP